MGIICAIRRGGFHDQALSVFANIGIAIPVFWLGILGIYFLGFQWSLLPIQGWTSPFDDLATNIRQAIMPIILLAVPDIAMMTRQTRSSILEVVRQDYIRTAYAKSMRERAVIYRHGLKNALFPVITLLGVRVRVLVSGSVLIESVFNIPGMGRLLVAGAFNKDFFVIQAGILLIGTVVCLANLLIDISYAWLDPRIRFD
jgi:peptide/nickel transport system permease protein